ncbi:MAG: HEAT repeat domain-containing protein [Halobacteriota archaeon]
MTNKADIDELISKLRSHDVSEHYDAYTSLLKPEIRTKLKDSELQSLINVFENGSEPSFVRSSAATVLGHTGDERTINWLVKPIIDDLDGKAVDAAVLRNAAVALGMIAQSMIQRTDTSLSDWSDTQASINHVVGKLCQSLGVRTVEYRSGSLFRYFDLNKVGHDVEKASSDLTKAVCANISYRIGLLCAIKMIGDVGPVVDTLAYIFTADPIRDDITILDEAIDALASCAVSAFYWNEKATGFQRGFSETGYAIKTLQSVEAMPEMYWQVRESARKALKFIEGGQKQQRE